MNAMLQQAILLIDTILIGGLGEEALAAMGIATAVAGLILGVIFALANGTQIIVAQAFGADSHQAISSGFWSGLAVGLSIAILGCLVIVLFHGNIITALAETQTIADYASTYLVIFCIVIIGVAVCQNISVFFYATANAKLPFYSKLLELPFNAALSYALIYGTIGFPTLGLAGAAIGSAAAVCLRALFLIACLSKQKYNLSTALASSLSTLQRAIAGYLQNALPIAGTFISMNLAFTVCMLSYSQLSTYEFAALTILLVWVRIGGQLTTSWCQAIGILVGQLLGQSRQEWLDEFVGKAWQVAIGLGVVIALIYSATPILFTVFYPGLQEETRAVIRSLLPVLIVLPLVRASNTVCGNVLRAGGQAGYAFKVHVCAQWVFTVPATLLAVLVFDLSILVVFSILALEEILKALPFHLRMREGGWKRKLV